MYPNPSYLLENKAPLQSHELQHLTNSVLITAKKKKKKGNPISKDGYGPDVQENILFQEIFLIIGYNLFFFI